MIKLSILMARRADLTYEEFLQHWSTTHAEVISKQPAARFIKRYVQCHRTGENLPGATESQFDGIAEVWFDSMQDAAGFFSSEDYRSNVFPDEDLFLDRSRCELLFSRDCVVIR
jgi:uncharacterized protein (TIGR02118 family)